MMKLRMLRMRGINHNRNLSSQMGPERSWINTEYVLIKGVIIFKWINEPDAANSQVYYLLFKYSSTCFGHPHAYHQELNNCSSSLWFYLCSVVIAVLLVVVGPTTTNSTVKFLGVHRHQPLTSHGRRDNESTIHSFLLHWDRLRYWE